MGLALQVGQLSLTACPPYFPFHQLLCHFANVISCHFYIHFHITEEWHYALNGSLQKSTRDGCFDADSC